MGSAGWIDVPWPWAFVGGAPGAGELLVVFLMILVLFGPRQLPRIARTIGKVLEQLRRVSHEFNDQIMDIDHPAVQEHPPRRATTPKPDAAARPVAAESDAPPPSEAPGT